MNRQEIIIRIPKILHDQIIIDLQRPHEFAYERVGFLGSQHKVVSSSTTIIFMTEYFPVKDEQYLNDPEVGARINSSAIRESLQRVIDNRFGSFHAHYHSFSNDIPEFSVTDLEDNPEIIKSFGYAGKNQVHGMIVFGKNGINALVNLPGDPELKQATKIVGVGYPMKISVNGNTRNTASKNRYSRQSFLGERSQLSFSQVRVGIVGLGGGGSHVVQQLSHLGVKNYVLFDYDRVDESNLNRMIGAGLNDVKNTTMKVVIAEKTIIHLHKDANIKIIEDNWINHPECVQECDIVFGCIDSFIGRRDLESECRRYLIPYIDIGMDVHNDYKNESPSLVGQIILSMPGNLCMHCMGFLTDKNLAKEAAKYGSAGGRPQVVWSNGVLASQAVGIFVDLMTGWSGMKELITYYSFDGNAGLLAIHPRLKYLNNSCDHYKIKDVGSPVYREII